MWPAARLPSPSAPLPPGRRARPTARWRCPPSLAPPFRAASASRAVESDEAARQGLRACAIDPANIIELKPPDREGFTRATIVFHQSCRLSRTCSTPTPPHRPSDPPAHLLARTAAS
ncbi:hypothetical protein BS78_03G267800 [Paspalum vaginatum]|nr:hypothetical protein BS78_03G267800 [Paspalum vaginatum]